MAMKFLIACLALLPFGAQAVLLPIPFATRSFDTQALAVGDGGPVFQADGPNATLSTASAVSYVSDVFASAGTTGTLGLLVANSEADGFASGAGGFANSQAHFVGTFATGGHLTLNLGFDDITSTIGGGSADGHLFVLLQNTVASVTTTLFNDELMSGLTTLQYSLPLGGTATLDLTLFSEASVADVGQSGQNFSQVAVSGTVPEPGTLLLLIAAFPATLVATRRRAWVPSA
jgi:hypothetical protein